MILKLESNESNDLKESYESYTLKELSGLILHI